MAHKARGCAGIVLLVLDDFLQGHAQLMDGIEEELAPIKFSTSGSEALATDDGLAELGWIRASFTEAILIADVRALYGLFHRRGGLCREARIDVAVLAVLAKRLELTSILVMTLAKSAAPPNLESLIGCCGGDSSPSSPGPRSRGRLSARLSHQFCCAEERFALGQLAEGFDAFRQVFLKSKTAFEVLMVAEKPSVAKLIAEILSGGRMRFRKGQQWFHVVLYLGLGSSRRGQSRAVQIYEFNSWFPPAHQQCRIMQTSTIGHVFGLDFKENRPKDIAELFHDPCKKTIEDGTAKNRIVEHFQELAAEADYLALWLDCDKEGENICFEVISLCAGHRPHGDPKAQFSALTEPELRGAYNNLGRPDKLAAQAVDASAPDRPSGCSAGRAGSHVVKCGTGSAERQELDLKIGCIFTRLMTRQYLRYAVEKSLSKAEGLRAKSPENSALDESRVEVPPARSDLLELRALPDTHTLVLLGAQGRSGEVPAQDYMLIPKRQEFYKPKISVNLDGWPLEFDWLHGQTFDAGRVKSLQSAQSAKHAVVKELRTTAKTLKKPVGLNTVQLLKAASTGLGMSPVQCMKVAEHLYTSGYISYPRTETTRYSDTFDLHAALREQADHPAWGKTVSHLLRQGQIRNPKTGRDVGDHPPITPMKAAPRDEFSKGSEWRLYDFITRHFIASLMPDVEYDEKALIVNMGGEDFAYTFHEMRERGFLFAMPWKSKELNLNEIDWAMPRLAPGSPLRVEEVWVESDFTKPPDYLKESELVALMDKHGIGTDASIPQHVENICNRNYVMVCGPGEDGQRGERIPKGGKKGKGKGKGKDGKAQGGEKPQSRHMVPTPLGLSFCAAFEELDAELCRPPIRAYMVSELQI
ncbi:TOP3B [Symbiodinium sp. CCMP2592]|nr:TOP3B [Symbiodinium sp. CCMP2592]